jgi:Protein of unknown function (DUF2961)
MNPFLKFAVAALVAACADTPDAADEETGEVAQALTSSKGLAALTDFDHLAHLKTDAWEGQQSSFDRSAGNTDWANYLYTDANGDKVLLDLSGPGCVYRTWFTGFQMSSRLKVYFDGEATPRIDRTLAEIFDGNNPPFLSPLVSNDAVSSGGFVSYLPLPYASSIRITTNDPGTNASPSAYYDINYHSFAPGSPVATWTGLEDSTSALALWRNVGNDPKSDAGNSVKRGALQLALRGQTTVAGT